MNALQKKAEKMATEDAKWVEENIKAVMTPAELFIAKIGIGRLLLRYLLNIKVVRYNSIGSSRIEIWRDGEKKVGSTRFYIKI